MDRGDCPQTLDAPPCAGDAGLRYRHPPCLPSPAADAAFETYPRNSRDDRIARLNPASEALLKIICDRLEDLAQAISTELGAPIAMPRSSYCPRLRRGAPAS